MPATVSQTTSAFVNTKFERGLMKLRAMLCRSDVINFGSLPCTDFRRPGVQPAAAVHPAGQRRQIRSGGKQQPGCGSGFDERRSLPRISYCFFGRGRKTGPTGRKCKRINSMEGA